MPHPPGDSQRAFPETAPPSAARGSFLPPAQKGGGGKPEPKNDASLRRPHAFAHPPPPHDHLRKLLPRLSACLDGEATLALLRTTHTQHYTEGNRCASLRWHWCESPARYTEAFWEAFRARWPDTNVGTLTLWLTTASELTLPTLFERPSSWPS